MMLLVPLAVVAACVVLVVGAFVRERLAQRDEARALEVARAWREDLLLAEVIPFRSREQRHDDLMRRLDDMVKS